MRFAFACTFAFTLLLLPLSDPAKPDGPSDNKAESVRPIPPPGIPIPDERRLELEASLERLGKEIADLASTKDKFILEYLPDVEIFHRAVGLALREDGFFEPADFDRAGDLLKEGMARAKALKDKGTPWRQQAFDHVVATVRGFRSKLDGTVQPYGVVQTPRFTGRGDIWCRGRSEKGLELQFLAARMKNTDPIPEPGTIMIHPFGRYCNANKLAGEIDTLEAIEHATREYGIDPKRIAIRGFSMGGAAAWHLAVHYPDRWFAATPGAGFSETPDFLKVFQSESLKPTWYEQKLWQMYDCPVWVRNLKMLPTIAYSGAIDKQKQAADIMAKASWELPESERFELAHIVAPNTAHQISPEARIEIERRLRNLDSMRPKRSPDAFAFTTCTLRYNRAHWLTIDELEEHWVPSTIRVNRENATVNVRVDSGIRQFTLDMDALDLSDSVDKLDVVIHSQNQKGEKTIEWLRGDKSIARRSDRSWGATFRNVDGKWIHVSPLEEPLVALRKRHALQGPIDDAFMAPFLFVRPTGQGMHPETERWAQREFDHAVSEWHRQMRGDARIKNSDELTPDDIQNFHLVLWGDPASNPTIAKVLNQLPMKWSNETLSIGGRTTDAKSHMPVMIYPNPLAPDRYLVLNSGFTYREYDYLNNARQVPKLPDWAIVDISTPSDSRWPGRIVDADFFDEAWQLKPQRPNIVLIFADDLGYGDLGCYGEQRWKTPHIDSIAANGIRFTDFHSSQPVCSASRASLLTGCYANRIGIHGALFPASMNGIHKDEVLIPELLKPFGYRNCMVGKWHLGHHPKFLPRQHGFDRYLGLPYSNDMWPHGTVVKKTTFPPLPLFRDNEVIDADVDAADQAGLTSRYTDLAVEFIRESRREPFFLYYAHTFPHVPLFASEEFAGRSPAGIYGDVMEEFDHAVGRILKELEDQGLTDNTLVIFTSDNGPWLTYGDHAGTAGPLREGKGTVYEGGIRVPMVAKWPGKIPAGSIQAETAMTIDILPTLARIVGAPLPKQTIDGLDILDLITAKPEAKCQHDAFYHYYRNGELQAIRSGPWKLMLPHTVNSIDPNALGSGGKPGTSIPRKIEQPELYNLDVDLGEANNIASKEPAVMAKLMGYVEQARQELGDSLVGIAGQGVRAPGMFTP